MSKLQKIISVTLAVTTTLWLSGVAMFAPTAQAVTINEGDLIRGPDGIKVYIVNDKGFKRHIFNPEVFNMYEHFSWDSIKDVSQATLDSYETSDLYRAAGDSKVYSLEEVDEAAGNAVKHWLDITAQEFVDAGYSWDQVFVVNAAERDYYETGDPITAADLGLEGASQYDNQADCEDAGYYWYDSACHEEAQAVTGNVLDVSLASDNPAAATIVSESSSDEGAESYIPFLKVKFTAGDEDVTVTDISFTRTGISADSDISQAYLYDGDSLVSGTKLAEYSSFDDKVLTFSNSSGLFEVGNGESKVVTLRIDLAEETSSGKTVGFKIASADDITSDAGSVEGSFPLEGNKMSTANVTDLGKLDVAHNSDPGSSTDAENDKELWKVKLTAEDQDINIYKMQFTNAGSVDDNDLQDLELKVSGTQYGETQAEMDGGKVTFDLSGDPITMNSGDVKYASLYGDIVGGVNRNFKFSIQAMDDVIAKDMEYGVYIRPNQSDSWSLVEASTATDINTGSLSVSRSSGSPTGYAAKDATSVTLAKFDLTAAGESVKISSLDVYVINSPTATSGLQNVKLMVDGSQKGTTKDISDTGTGNAKTFSFGNTFIVDEATTDVLEVKADVKDGSGNSFATDATLKVGLKAKTSNAQGRSSLSSVDVPGSNTTAYQLTVKGGTLNTAVNQAMPNADSSNPTGVPGSQDAKLASFSLTAGAGEGVDVSSVKVTAASNALFNNVSNILIKRDTDGDGIGDSQIGSTWTSPSSGGNKTFSANFSLDAAESQVFDVYGDIGTGAATGSVANAIVVSQVDGTGQDTGSSANDTSGANGQTVYIAANASLSVRSVDTPYTDILLMGDTAQVFSKFNFEEITSAEDVDITKVTVTVLKNGSAANTADIKNVKLYVDDELIGSHSSADSTIDFDGLSWVVKAGETDTLTVKADIGAHNVATSGDYIQIRLASDAVTARGSISGTDTGTDPSSNLDGNKQYLRYARPTITTSDVTVNGNDLTDGSKTLYKFKVASTNETTAFYQFKFNVSTNGATIASPDVTNITENDSGNWTCSKSGSTITCTNSQSTGEEVAVGSPETFALKATVSGANSQGDSVSIYMNEDSSATSSDGTAATIAATENIVWSDEDSTSHATTTSDWTNGYLVEDNEEYTTTQTLLFPY